MTYALVLSHLIDAAEQKQSCCKSSLTADGCWTHLAFCLVLWYLGFLSVFQFSVSPFSAGPFLLTSKCQLNCFLSWICPLLMRTVYFLLDWAAKSTTLIFGHFVGLHLVCPMSIITSYNENRTESVLHPQIKQILWLLFCLPFYGNDSLFLLSFYLLTSTENAISLAGKYETHWI